MNKREGIKRKRSNAQEEEFVCLFVVIFHRPKRRDFKRCFEEGIVLGDFAFRGECLE